jgi:hypothetical protein
MSILGDNMFFPFCPFHFSLKWERDSKGRDVEVMTRPAAGSDLIAFGLEIMMPQSLTQL